MIIIFMVTIMLTRRSNSDSYLDIPNISSGDELLEDMELMEREPFDMRPTEALLELLANGGS